MDVPATLLGEGGNLMVAVLVFLAAGMLAFSIMAAIRVQGAVRRRAANIASIGGPDRPGGPRLLRASGRNAALRMIGYTARHYSGGNNEEMKVLRRRLVQAGIYDANAVAYFFLGRTALAVGIAVAAFLLVPAEPGGAVHWLIAGLGGLAGYLAPTLYLDRRIKASQAEHRTGFPDFLDLLVVCADAGLSMEASLERVGRELVDSYPSLAANIHMTNLEIRAGRAMTSALEHFAERLGLEEARSFATLIQQSVELGSSVTDALRVYSDDMRHKRMSRAEEKAYSLPAKLALPMMICIFPVIFVVILLPVAVRLMLGQY